MNQFAHDRLPPWWAEAPVLELATTITKGSTPTTYGHDYKETGISFVRVENLADGHIDHETLTAFIDESAHTALRRSQLQTGDVLYSIAGTIGRTAIVREQDLPANTNQALAIIRGTDTVVISSYLIHFLSSSSSQHRTLLKARGGAMNNISLSDIGKIVVPVAPRGEQKRIVEEIDKQFTRLDAAVAALKRVQANLKRYRAAVLKAACEGKLVPTEAELARKEGRSYETGEQLLTRILKQRRSNKGDDGKKKCREPQVPDTTGLLELPDGWTWASPDQLANFDDNAICAGPFGTIFKAKDFRSEGVPIIFLRHVSAGRYHTHKPGFMDRDVWERLFRPYSVFGGELLITKLGEPPGISAVYPKGLGPAMVTPDVIKVSVNETAASPRFLMHYFNSDKARRFSTDACFGTTRLRLTLPIFRRMPVTFPPLAEQARIVAEVERQLSDAEALGSSIDAQLARADRLRQSILKRSFEGKLVPQDPNDEPASVLLERIRAQRTAKINELPNPRGKTRRTLASVEKA